VSIRTRSGSWSGSISENVDSIAPAARLACPRCSAARGPITITESPRSNRPAATDSPTTPVPITATSATSRIALTRQLGRCARVVGGLRLYQPAPSAVDQAVLVTQRGSAVRNALLIDYQQLAPRKGHGRRGGRQRLGEALQHR